MWIDMGEDIVATLDLAERGADAGARAPTATPMLQISVLGPLTILRGDTRLTAGDLGGPKPRQVLEILLLSFGSAVSKSRIIDLLWNGKHPAVALPTLESYVSVLRRNLQPGNGRTGPLRTVTGGYVMDSSLVDLDLGRFDTLTRKASQAAPAAALALLTEALDVASSPLLGDELLPAWAEEERIAHAGRVAHARVRAAEAALTTGDVHRAIAWGEAAVRDDPLDERAWTALILGLEGNGENTAALRAFGRCRKAIGAELGCAPGAVLREAQTRLLGTTAAPSSPSSPHAGSRPIGIREHQTGETQVEAREDQEARRLRILIADDHTTFSDLLAGALDREPDFLTIGAAATVDAVVSLYLELRPDIVVMDLYLADGSGLNAAERILAEVPGVRIVMLSGNPSQGALREAARLGICGFLPKDGTLGLMLDTLRHARPGTMIVHPSLVVRLGAAAEVISHPADV